MIKNIYFDFGAVLVNYENVFQKVCSDFSLDFNEFWKFYDLLDEDMAYGKITTDEFWEKCIEKFNLKDAKNYDLTRWWVSDYEIIKPINDLIYFLENKKEVGIISNIGSGVWEAAMKYEFVPNIKYKKVYLSYKEGMIKPNLNFYQKVQKESLIKPDEISEDVIVSPFF
jgi:FMN phosphatase YigB (HAD superfamily)